MDAVARLSAIEAIKSMKGKYFRGVDLKDANLLRDVFTDDVELDYQGAVTDPITGENYIPSGGGASGGSNGAEMIVAALQGIVSVHHASVPEIEITGETTATGIWPMVDRLKFPASAPLKELIGYGHYHEDYALVDGKWKIRKLRLTRLRIDVTK